jgi:hypothetical protein
MAGMTGSHWADVILLAAVPADGIKLGSIFLPETFYLYRALVAGHDEQ